MDTLVVLFVIIAVISNLTKKSKEKAAKEKAKRARAQQAQQAKQPQAAQPHRPAAQQTTMGEDIFPWVTPEPPKATPKPAQPTARQQDRPAEGQSVGGSLGGPFTEGRSTQGSMAASSTEGLGTAEGTASGEGVGMGGSLGGARPRQAADRRSRHVVQPFTEGNHQHTESSMTGAMACPPVRESRRSEAKAAATVPAYSQTVGQYNLSFDRNSLIAGFLYGEILGKPRSLAPHHGYRR